MVHSHLPSAMARLPTHRLSKAKTQAYSKSPQTNVGNSLEGIAKMRRKQSPKIGILGNSTFSTEAGTSKRKLESIPANTINSVIKNIEVSFHIVVIILYHLVSRNKLYLVMNNWLYSREKLWF